MTADIVTAACMIALTAVAVAVAIFVMDFDERDARGGKGSGAWGT